MIEYSPEFDEFKPEVIRSAVFDGAAKVAGIISLRSVNRLKMLLDTSVLEPAKSLASELEEVIDTLMTPQNTALGMTYASDLFMVEAQKTTGVPHKDSKKS